MKLCHCPDVVPLHGRGRSYSRRRSVMLWSGWEAACRGGLGPSVISQLVESQVLFSSLSGQSHAGDYRISKSTWRTSGLRCYRRTSRSYKEIWFLFLCRLNLKTSLWITSLTFYHLEFFLQAVHLGPQGVDNVLPVFQHEVFQLLRGLHLLNVLQNDKKQWKKRKKNWETYLTYFTFAIIGKNDGSEKTDICWLLRRTRNEIWNLAMQNMDFYLNTALNSKPLILIQ